MPSLLSRVATGLIGAALAGSPASINAQTFGNLRTEEFLDILQSLAAALDKPRSAVLQGVATGVTLPSGNAFASVSGTNRREGQQGVDGSLAFGLGLGDARKTIGAEIFATITSVHPADFGDSGSLGLKLSRVLPDDLGKGSVGITVENLASWGDVVGEEVKVSLAWTTSGHFTLGSVDSIPVVLNVGIASSTDHHDSWTPFGAIGIGLFDNYTVSVAHNGDYAIIGASTYLDWNENVSLHGSVMDVFDLRDERRVTLTISYAINDLF